MGLMAGRVNVAPSVGERQLGQVILAALPKRPPAVEAKWRAALACLPLAGVQDRHARCRLARQLVDDVRFEAYLVDTSKAPPTQAWLAGGLCLARAAIAAFDAEDLARAREQRRVLGLLVDHEAKQLEPVRHDYTLGLPVSPGLMLTAAMALDELDATCPTLASMPGAHADAPVAASVSADPAPSPAGRRVDGKGGRPRGGRKQEIRHALQLAPDRSLSLTQLTLTLRDDRELVRKAANEVVKLEPQHFGKRELDGELIYFSR